MELSTDALIEFLRTIKPPLSDEVLDRFLEHELTMEDIRDPRFGAEALDRMGVRKVGLQLRIMRAVHAICKSDTNAYHLESIGDRRHSDTQYALSRGASSRVRKEKKDSRAPSHGLSLEAIESMDSSLVPKILCVTTPSLRPLWEKYPEHLGMEMLRRVDVALSAAPAGIPNFEVPVIINMLLWESTRASFMAKFDFGNEQKDLLPSGKMKALVRCLLPLKGDETFEWFRSAPEEAMEALVLPFDKKLLSSYEERPRDLVMCLIEAVHTRVKQHFSRERRNPEQVHTDYS